MYFCCAPFMEYAGLRPPKGFGRPVFILWKQGHGGFTPMEKSAVAPSCILVTALLQPVSAP